MVKQGEQKRVQDRVVVTERDQAGSLGKLADAVRGQNTGKLVQKPEQPAEEQTEVTEQLLFAGQGMRCRYGWGYRTCTVFWAKRRCCLDARNSMDSSQNRKNIKYRPITAAARNASLNMRLSKLPDSSACFAAA